MPWPGVAGCSRVSSHASMRRAVRSLSRTLPRSALICVRWVRRWAMVVGEVPGFAGVFVGVHEFSDGACHFRCGGCLGVPFCDDGGGLAFGRAGSGGGDVARLRCSIPMGRGRHVGEAASGRPLGVEQMAAHGAPCSRGSACSPCPRVRDVQAHRTGRLPVNRRVGSLTDRPHHAVAVSAVAH